MERRAIIHKLNQNSYCIDDAGESLSYVVLGSAKAAVIDTANGRENLLQVVREITDLPRSPRECSGGCRSVRRCRGI